MRNDGCLNDLQSPNDDKLHQTIAETGNGIARNYFFTQMKIS